MPTWVHLPWFAAGSIVGYFAAMCLVAYWTDRANRDRRRVHRDIRESLGPVKSHVDRTRYGHRQHEWLN